MDLTAQDVLRSGGWDRRFARVLVVVSDEQCGVALVDTNGDGLGIEVEVLVRDREGWRGSVSSGFVPSHETGVLGHGETPDCAYAYGRVDPPGPVTLTVAGRKLRAEATAEGWWAWCRASGGSR